MEVVYYKSLKYYLLQKFCQFIFHLFFYRSSSQNKNLKIFNFWYLMNMRKNILSVSVKFWIVC